VGRLAVLRKFRHTFFRLGLPVGGTVGLLTWLFYHVPVPEVIAAAGQIDWPAVVLFTLILVVSLFLWDGVCLSWLFTDPGKRFSYRHALWVRGQAYLLTVVHLGMGQGLLAYLVSRVRQIPFLTAVGRCLIMLYVDVGLLFLMGMLAAIISHDPRTEGIARFCALGLLGLALVTLLAFWIPQFLSLGGPTKWGTAVAAAGIPWIRVICLYPLRFIYFLFGLVHAGVILALCDVWLDASTIVSVMPLTSLADGLPISVAGLGTRETLFLTLLEPPQPAAVLAGSLIWWVTMLVGRAGIGLILLWLSVLGLAYYGPAIHRLNEQSEGGNGQD